MHQKSLLKWCCNFLSKTTLTRTSSLWMATWSPTASAQPSPTLTTKRSRRLTDRCSSSSRNTCQTFLFSSLLETMTARFMTPHLLKLTRQNSIPLCLTFGSKTILQIDLLQIKRKRRSWMEDTLGLICRTIFLFFLWILSSIIKTKTRARLDLKPNINGIGLKLLSTTVADTSCYWLIFTQVIESVTALPRLQARSGWKTRRHTTLIFSSNIRTESFLKLQAMTTGAT